MFDRLRKKKLTGYKRFFFFLVDLKNENATFGFNHIYELRKQKKGHNTGYFTGTELRFDFEEQYHFQLLL